MDWTAPLDLYCERLAPGFWAEPLNAISNAAFLIAAALAIRALRRSGRSDRLVMALAMIVGLIGIGSFLFHVFANRWSVIADVAPITLFIYLYLALALRRFVGLSPVGMMLGVGLYFLLSWPVEQMVEPLLAGSSAYAPALLALLAIGGLLTGRGHRAGPYLLAAGTMFAISLTLRTLDLPLCDTVPIGTHFIWHVLNAVTLTVLLLAAIPGGGKTVAANRA